MFGSHSGRVTYPSLGMGEVTPFEGTEETPPTLRWECLGETQNN